jgi:hypothetical protein
MTIGNPIFKALSNFGIDDMPSEATISRLMLQRLESIDDATTAGPVTEGARAALASSVIAHALIELEAQVIELKRQLEQRK